MTVPPVRRWLVEAAQRIDAALGPARVARVALPPLMDNPGKEGEFCAVQLDDGAVGLAFTLLEQGDDLDHVEHVLHDIGFHPTLCRESAIWAHDRHQRAFEAAVAAGHDPAA